MKRSIVRGLFTMAMFLTAGLAARPAQATTFHTSDGQLTPGIDNRGWWSATVSNDDFNDDCSVGMEAGEEVRNFFTFDLSPLSSEWVVSARLEVQAYFGAGDPTETLGLFDVSTNAWRLNQNDGTSGAIFQDLGSGKSYGSFEVSTTAPPDGLLRFPLSWEAVADINAARGGFFSIGGALTSLTSTRGVTSTGGLPREMLLTSSFGIGTQRLVVCLTTDLDGDGDRVCDLIDNCGSLFNNDQRDRDNDGLGDECDPCPDGESDGDGVCDRADVCRYVDNANQADLDGDRAGDACDNCPATFNAGQEDSDFDGLGDACDPTPVHDLAIDLLKASIVSLHAPGSGTLQVNVTVANLTVSPEDMTVTLAAERLPDGCVLGSSPRPLHASVSALGKRTVTGHFDIACDASPASGGHPVVVTAFVQANLTAHEISFIDNTGSVTARLIVQP